MKGDATDGIVQRGSIALLGGIVGGALILGNEVLAARLLGAEVYGVYALAFALARVGEVVSLFGLQLAVLHFLPIYLSQGAERSVAGTIMASLALPAALAAGLIALFWQLAPWFAEQVLEIPSAEPYLRAFALVVPFMALSEILGAITRGYGHAAYYVVIRQLVPPVVYLMGLLTLFATRADPLWIAGAFGAAWVSALLAGLVSLARVAGTSIVHVRPRFALGKIYAFSLPVAVNALFYVVLGVTDIVMLGSLRGSEETGVYRGCLQLVAVFPMIVIAFTAAAAHVYPVLAHERRGPELEAAYATVTRWMTASSVAAFALIATNRVDLLSLLGPSFTVGAGALLLLLLAQMIRSLVGSGAFLLVVSRNQMLETALTAVGVVVNVLLNLVLIPRYGIVGAGLATVSAYLVISSLRVILIRRALGFLALQTRMLKVVLAGAAASLPVVGGAELLGVGDGTGLLHMIFRMSLLAVLLLAALWRFGLEPADRERVRGAFAARGGG